MKKLFSCIIAMSIILSAVCVSASDKNQVNVSYDAMTQKITINGTFEPFLGKITVLVSKYSEGLTDTYDDITASNISQNVIQFATWDGEGDLILNVSSSVDTGFYMVLCSASGFSGVASKVFYITNSEEQNVAVNAFKTATPDNIETVLNNWSVTSPVIPLDLSKPIYEAYTKDVQKALAGCIADEVAKLTVSSQADEFTMNSIFTCYERALALVDFNTASDKISKFVEYAKLLETDSEKVTDDNREKVIALMPAQTNAENGNFFSQSAFNKALEKSVAICEVNGKSRDDVKDALKANEEIIGVDVDAGYESANASELNAAMALRSFTTTEEIKIAFETAVAENPKKQSGSSSSGGSSSGGSSGGSSSGGSTTSIGRPTINPTPEVDKYPGYTEPKDVFRDIYNYAWAKEAITFLSEKAIINGDGNGNFEPARNIKREEYAKIIVEAFDLKGNGETKKFDDVNEDAWYYDYIQAAYKNDIIYGVNEDSFGTGSFITRQDAAVMIYRYLQKTGYTFSDEFAIDFADIDDCAEYAKTAIKLLKNSGLINGNEDNTFRPENFLSRAEAAVLIYNIMSEVEAK